MLLRCNTQGPHARGAAHGLSGHGCAAAARAATMTVDSPFGSSAMSARLLTNQIETQIAALRDTGYVIVRGLLAPERLARLRAVAQAQLLQHDAPLEYEADLRYPGAPQARTDHGGETVRRLLDAYARDAQFAQFASDESIVQWLRQYFDSTVSLSRAHHNCLMTKHPTYGSLTGWHRDFRYWAFERDDLVSTWLALGPETAANGGLWFVPGSHRMVFGAERFDAAKFFRSDLPENQALIATAVSPELHAGDVVFFHCNTLHSAGRNTSSEVKLSLVFTYHGADNAPLPGTRSAAKPEVVLHHTAPRD
jgi:phytanoyl-CoA hydroxylase